MHEYGVPVIEVAAALGALAQGNKPLTARVSEKQKSKAKDGEAGRREKPLEEDGQRRERKPPRDDSGPARGMERFRIEVGHSHGVKPGNIVGAIANEAEIDAQYIGRIDINDDYSTVDLPEGMPKEVFRHLKSVWVSGQRLQISRAGEGGNGGKPPRRKSGKKPAKHKGRKRTG